ncbi:MAG TPA: HD domain-containing protein [Candidatus Ozemobacteraceae bacterium]|nr:HD domain-containing protein [Candidatus Ozemobacteraceae bacterium]
MMSRLSPLSEHEPFLSIYRQLSNVSMNPRLHTCTTVFEHAELVRQTIARLGRQQGSSVAELVLFDDLALAHDIGKLRGHPHEHHSVAILQDLGETDAAFLSLVKHHDIALPWYRSTQQGTPPTDAAWLRLAAQFDLWLLCLFAIADRADCPGGWQQNPPTIWFLQEVKRRNLVRRSLPSFDVPSTNPPPDASSP